MKENKTAEKTKAVIVGEKYDEYLANSLISIVNTNHKYVNPTLKRLATSAGNRLNKLRPTAVDDAKTSIRTKQ